MKIEEFITKYENIATENLKEKFIKNNLEVKTYLPFSTKVTLAERLADITCFERKDVVGNNWETIREKTGNVQVDSVAQYLFFFALVIDNYTNLEVDFSDFSRQFDLLMQSDVLDKIIMAIPDSEIGNFKMICNMKKDDTITNYCEIHNYVSKQLSFIKELVDKYVGLIPDDFLENIAGSITK